MTPMQQAAFTRGLISESGGDLSKVSTSYATADRSRRKVLKTISEECHEQWIPPALCTLHWDSKLTQTLDNVRQKEERLTVVVGDNTQLKLLGVPAYTKGADEACGTIIGNLTCKLLQIALSSCGNRCQLSLRRENSATSGERDTSSLRSLNI